MTALPAGVRARVQDFIWRARSPAYLHLTDDGRVLACGGNLGLYGLEDLASGSDAAKAVPFLVGLFPGAGGDEPHYLPALHLGGGVVADAVVVGDRSGAWVVLFDLSDAHGTRQRVQQSAHDLARMFGLADADRRRVTVARLEIRYHRGRTGAPPTPRAREVASAASHAASAFLQTGGFTDISIGGAVTAIVGLQDSDTPAAELAADCALGLVLGRPACGARVVSAGLATGVCEVAATGPAGQRRLEAVGEPVYRAARLAAMASPGRVLIDEPSFEDLGPSRKAFRPSDRISPNDGRKAPLYVSCEPQTPWKT